MRLSHFRSLRSKKRLLLGAAALLVLLLGAYIIWSRDAWTQLTPRYTRWHQSIKADIESMAALPINTNKEKDAAITTLERIADRMAADQSMACSITPLVQWQQAIIPAYKEAYTVCQKKMAVVSSFQKQLVAVIAYNKSDRMLSGIIAAAAPSADNLTEEAWGVQVAAWSDAINAAEKMAVASDFKPTQQSALERMASIKLSWQDLIASHETKDKQKYLAAQSALATAIDGLNDVAATSQQAFSKLTSELEITSQRALAD